MEQSSCSKLIQNAKVVQTNPFESPDSEFHELNTGMIASTETKKKIYQIEEEKELADTSENPLDVAMIESCSNSEFGVSKDILFPTLLQKYHEQRVTFPVFWDDSDSWLIHPLDRVFFPGEVFLIDGLPRSGRTTFSYHLAGNLILSNLSGEYSEEELPRAFFYNSLNSTEHDHMVDGICRPRCRDFFRKRKLPLSKAERQALLFPIIQHHFQIQWGNELQSHVKQLYFHVQGKKNPKLVIMENFITYFQDSKRVVQERFQRIEAFAKKNNLAIVVLDNLNGIEEQFHDLFPNIVHLEMTGNSGQEEDPVDLESEDKRVFFTLRKSSREAEFQQIMHQPIYLPFVQRVKDVAIYEEIEEEEKEEGKC